MHARSRFRYSVTAESVNQRVLSDAHTCKHTLTSAHYHVASSKMEPLKPHQERSVRQRREQAPTLAFHEILAKGKDMESVCDWTACSSLGN